ncbi:MAG TPA: hypothetical protein GX505_00530 [Clostridiales bacterium]|nr:hypothetical protein [Clostridiales bacterium]
MKDKSLERTGFQESAPYSPSIDLKTDFVMVYGIDDSMPERVKKWKEKGYVVHLMTGVAWGRYQDYLYGKYDGRSHWDEAQKDQDGNYILHGRDVPYMVPTVAFADYLTENIKKAVDAGVEAIHLEEPEFWVRGGYSDAFKREWEIYYGEPWIAPHESADAQYRASKLKAYLYTRCLDRLCSSLKEYAKVYHNRNIRFYVPTHSLINYTQWGIVSPESNLLELPAVDGYIAQIWTGTSRTKNVYQGVRKERTFETAFLEYGIMQELVRGTKRRMWFLHDPIEDNPNYTWSDYRYNYFRTVVASLLHPGISSYEVAPWPNRIFNREYPKEDGSGKERIPSDYAAVLLVVMNTLRNMDQKDVRWKDQPAVAGILLADSGMFQRYPKEAFGQGYAAFKNSKEIMQTVADWSAFYGMALPLLKHGLNLRPVQLENIRRFPGYLDGYKILLLSYEFMKPEYPDIHNALAQWVTGGGVLIYVGDDSDAYHGIRAWWNQGKTKYASPREHLFECLGLDKTPVKSSPGDYHSEKPANFIPVGKGLISWLNIHPSLIASSKNNANLLREVVKKAIAMKNEPGLSWSESNHFVLHRGPYVIAAVMDESVDDNPVELEGLFVDLFHANLKIRKKVVLQPGENCFLYDLNYCKNQEPKVIAASSRIDEIIENEAEYRLSACGPEGVPGRARIYTGRPIQTAKAICNNDEVKISSEWDEESKTVLLAYENKADGLDIILR